MGRVIKAGVAAALLLGGCMIRYRSDRPARLESVEDEGALHAGGAVWEDLAPPLPAFEYLRGWTVAAEPPADGSFRREYAPPPWPGWVGRIECAATGSADVVRLIPPAPIEIPTGADMMEAALGTVTARPPDQAAPAATFHFHDERGDATPLIWGDFPASDWRLERRPLPAAAGVRRLVAIEIRGWTDPAAHPLRVRGMRFYRESRARESAEEVWAAATNSFWRRFSPDARPPEDESPAPPSTVVEMTEDAAGAVSWTWRRDGACWGLRFDPRAPRRGLALFRGAETLGHLLEGNTVLPDARRPEFLLRGARDGVWQAVRRDGAYWRFTPEEDGLRVDIRAPPGAWRTLRLGRVADAAPGRVVEPPFPEPFAPVHGWPAESPAAPALFAAVAPDETVSRASAWDAATGVAQYAADDGGIFPAVRETLRVAVHPEPGRVWARLLPSRWNEWDEPRALRAAEGTNPPTARPADLVWLGVRPDAPTNAAACAARLDAAGLGPARLLGLPGVAPTSWRRLGPANFWNFPLDIAPWEPGWSRARLRHAADRRWLDGARPGTQALNMTALPLLLSLAANDFSAEPEVAAAVPPTAAARWSEWADADALRIAAGTATRAAGAWRDLARLARRRFGAQLIAPAAAAGRLSALEFGGMLLELPPPGGEAAWVHFTRAALPDGYAVIGPLLTPAAPEAARAPALQLACGGATAFAPDATDPEAAAEALRRVAPARARVSGRRPTLIGWHNGARVEPLDEALFSESWRAGRLYLRFAAPDTECWINLHPAAPWAVTVRDRTVTLPPYDWLLYP